MNDADGRAGLPDWPRALGTPVLGARIRSEPDDFRVTELAAFELDGSGEHDWLLIEKRGLNTAWLAERLAVYAGVPPRDVGYAGLKDRHAVARQWFSVRRPGGDKADWSAFDLPGARVIEKARHSRKLKRGAHRGNAFELCLCAVDGDPAPRLADIEARGVPNYFGEQRFGRDGSTLRLAARLFEGRRLKRYERGLALSAARAFLFNEILSRRVAAGAWDRLVPGDVANLDGSGSVFDVAGVDDALAARCAAFDLHPTGALWGRERDDAGSRLLASEREAAAPHPAMRAGLERHADAARRPLRLRVAGLRWEQDGDTLALSFTLPRGAYATAVLRELARYTA